MAKAFNNPIHAFRGFAIINIMAIHAFAFVLYYAGTNENPAGTALSILGPANSILLHDSTLYFTFISGILFSMILAERGYARFYQSKFSYVLLPYLFFTILYSLRFMDGPPGSPTVFFDGSATELLRNIGFNLLTGKSIPIFWYVPVLTSLYLATPLLARLVATERGTWIKALIILAPLVCSRVWPAVSWTNYVYFLGAYLIGLIVGAHYQQSLQFIERYRLWLIAVAIGSSAAIYFKGFFEIPTVGITNLEESAWYIQKIAFAGLVLLWFEKTMTSVPKWLGLLGEYAFALYFTHIYILIEIVAYISGAGILLDTGPMIFLTMVGVFLLMTGISVLLIFTVKALIGTRSRYFLGA